MKEKYGQYSQADAKYQELVGLYSSYFPPEVISGMVIFSEKNSEAVVTKLKAHEDSWTDPFEDRSLKKVTLEQLPRVRSNRERATLAGAWVLCSVREGFSYGNLILGEDFL